PCPTKGRLAAEDMRRPRGMGTAWTERLHMRPNMAAICFAPPTKSVSRMFSFGAWKFEPSYETPGPDIEGTPTTSLKNPWAEAPIDQGQTSGSRPYASMDPLIAAFTTLAL